MLLEQHVLISVHWADGRDAFSEADLTEPVQSSFLISNCQL